MKFKYSSGNCFLGLTELERFLGMSPLWNIPTNCKTGNFPGTVTTDKWVSVWKSVAPDWLRNCPIQGPGWLQFQAALSNTYLN